MVQAVESMPARSLLDETLPVDDYRRQRDEARSLLESLVSAKAECEAHQARFNRPDMFRAVTGRSALDAAIASTRRMIERLDAALERAESQVEVKVASVSGDRLRRGPRLA
jgi:hypothetical protein